MRLLKAESGQKPSLVACARLAVAAAMKGPSLLFLADS